MPLNIPSQDLARWGHELIEACHVSLQSRRQRGATFRNVYLTGHPNGTPQTYKKTYSYIQTRAAMLYSPTELRFMVAPTGPAGPRERAMGRAAAVELHSQVRAGCIDTIIDQAVEWALVKGKTFVQLQWQHGMIQPYMVQPETMGVLNDDLPTLDRQDAFVHSLWMTENRFAQHIANHPRRAELMSRIKSFASPTEDKPDEGANQRQVMIGGQLYPFRAQGQPGAGQGRGLVNWLQAPSPEMDTKTLATLIRLDELWVWDRLRDDWSTFQFVGNEMIEPTYQHRNIFAEGAMYEKGGKKIKKGESDPKNNPLVGHHGFCEICPNELPDYFWGWSEIMNVAVLQEAINNRVDGINRLLRRQEEPAWLIGGVSTPINVLRNRLRKPGGFHTEPGAGGQIKVEKMTPDLPQGLWESLHELEGMFDQMAGMPPVMQGQGEQGVRAQAHAETLVRMAGARLKSDSLTVERQIEEIGGVSFDMLRGNDATIYPYWVKQSDVGPFEGKTLDPLAFEAPAPGLVAIGFDFPNLRDGYKVTVDSHSSSPAFSREAEQKAATLLKAGALDPEGLIRALHPANEDELIADWETRQAAQAEFLKQHPEVLYQKHGGGGKKH